MAESSILTCGTNFVQILQLKPVDKVTVFSLFMIYILLTFRALFLLILRPRFSEPAIDIYFFKTRENKYCARISIII